MKNPVAKIVRTPLFKKRVIKSKKIYNRKTLPRDYLGRVKVYLHLWVLPFFFPHFLQVETCLLALLLVIAILFVH